MLSVLVEFVKAADIKVIAAMGDSLTVSKLGLSYSILCKLHNFSQFAEVVFVDYM